MPEIFLAFTQKQIIIIENDNFYFKKVPYGALRNAPSIVTV
jgi:hypothetical protein